MRTLPLQKAFTLIEPGPVVWVTTWDGERPNVMTLTWTMVLDFTPRFALATGPWNHSYAALAHTRECVLAIPDAPMLDQVVGVGTCSGRDTDKFARFGLTPVAAQQVRAPLIKECLANIECKVVDIVQAHGIVVLEGVAAHVSTGYRRRPMVHAVGDGTFVVDGEHLSRRTQMRSKLPPGV